MKLQQLFCAKRQKTISLGNILRQMESRSLDCLKTRNFRSQIFSAEEITGIILQKMKETAESNVGTEVKHAVVTVPPTFMMPNDKT